MNTLIITSTVYINSTLTVLIDEKERVKQYLESILFYLKSKFIDQIIICDNSNFDYSQFDSFFNSFSTINIEYLNFKGNRDKIFVQGKGYGEGEIIEYIFKNSVFLKKAGKSFLKVTGRIKVTNIDDVIRFSKDDEDYFQPAGSNPFKNLKAIDTRFYQCTFNTFEKYLIDQYNKVNDNKGVFLEHCYYNLSILEGIKFATFNILPIIEGVSGSTGVSYNEGRIKLIVKKTLFFIAKKLNRIVR